MDSDTQIEIFNEYPYPSVIYFLASSGLIGFFKFIYVANEVGLNFNDIPLGTKIDLVNFDNLTEKIINTLTWKDPQHIAEFEDFRLKVKAFIQKMNP